MLDIDKMIEGLEEFSADSVEYKLNYRKDGILYRIKLNIEKIYEEINIEEIYEKSEEE